MATSSGLFLATIYNQSQLAERKHVARYWLINTAPTAVPLSAHPSSLVITMKLAAAILGGGLFGGGVLPARYCPCGVKLLWVNSVLRKLSVDVFAYKQRVCHLKSVPFHGANCSDAAGRQLAYPEMVTKAKQSFTGILWDSIAQSPYATYKVKSLIS